MGRKRKKRKPITYKLYAFRLTEENLAMVQNKRFYRITLKYILLYDCNEQSTAYNEIGANELHYLSFQDRQWLQDCNMVIITEDTEKHKDEIAMHMNLMMDNLENALKAEKAKGIQEDNAAE